MQAKKTEMANSLFEICAKSLAKPSKKKNGDYFKYRESEEFVLAVVADGISSQPCDGYASELCCEGLSDLVEKKYSHTSNLEKLLEDSLIEINERLLLISGECEGLGSTICGILWPRVKDEFLYFWLGDSKVILYQSFEVTQLSIDDKETVVSSKDILPGRSIFARNYLSNSMGRRDNQIRIKKSKFHPGNSVILATDGFTESTYSFTNTITQVVNAFDMQKAVEDSFRNSQSNQIDDSTVVIIRRKTNPTEEEIEGYRNNLLNFPADPSYEELNIVFNGLIRGIEQTDLNLSLRMIEKIKTRNLKIEREALIGLLDEVTKKQWNSNALYQELVFLIRKS